MKRVLRRVAGWAAISVTGWVLGPGCASSSRLAVDTPGGLGRGWTILREQPDAWRLAGDALEVRVLPGNMWGGANDARNTFVRPAPNPARGAVEVSVRVENRPTEQYEQVDLVWYYADSHQVKIGQELVDGKLSLVMGREEGDRTRTIAIIPLDSAEVELRFEVRGHWITGSYRTPSTGGWRVAGGCDVPARGEPKISLQVYQGTTQVERWARISEFRVVQER